MRTLTAQHNSAKTEADELRQDLEAVNNHLGMLVEQQEASIRREKELRAQVVAVHDQLMRRDEEYRTSSADLQAKLRQAHEQLALARSIHSASDRASRRSGGTHRTISA